MLALEDSDTSSKRSLSPGKMCTKIYEDMENGGQKNRQKMTVTTPKAYQKWFMLAILSVLSAMNQGICYSYAPIASIVEKRWEERLHSTELITVYFISYIPCSFVGSWIMDKKGLRYGVLLGGFLQAFGASLRYFACAFGPTGEASVTLFGQILASTAMPFMVNSPAVLSANWFPPSMRATSTSVAVNANAMGTAFVYLTAPFIVLSSEQVPYWNLYVALFAVGSWIIAYFFFRSFPKTGVAQSIVSDVQLRGEYDWAQWATAFTHSGFWHTVAAFSVAECVLKFHRWCNFSRIFHTGQIHFHPLRLHLHLQSVLLFQLLSPLKFSFANLLQSGAFTTSKLGIGGFFMVNIG